jgi:L-iditol 2-dehydrogenase
MKALVLTHYNQFDVQDIERPSIADDEVLIQVKACGVCGSDVHGMDGSSGRRQPPIVMGHEASGVISDVGARVSDWQPGDRVTFDSTLYCGTCPYCRKGAINLCDNRRVLGVSCDDYRQNGAFAEYVAVPERILYRLPDQITFEQAAMVEALSIAVHAVEITPLRLNDTAVVIGSGMIGLLVIQTLRAAGCGQIIAVDVEAQKLNLAHKLGATALVNASEPNAMKELATITQCRGADLAFEVVGGSETLKMAVLSLRKGGCLTAIGNLAPTIEFPLQAVVTRQIRVQGSCASSGEYPACLDMIAAGTINVDALISATPPLSEGGEWFQRLYQKEQGLMKVILKP